MKSAEENRLGGLCWGPWKVETDEVRTIDARTCGAWMAVLYRHFPLEQEPVYRRAYQREFRRYDTYSGAASLEYMQDAGGGARKMVRRWGAVLDVSPRGLMVRLREQVRESTPVQLEIALENEVVHAQGIVRHCTQTVGGYKVGIELCFEGA